jgi:hypothetical protein
LNIGDSYLQTGGHGSQGSTSQRKGRRNVDAQNAMKGAKVAGIGAGNLCLIPWRLAIALQDAGWIVRSVVCWHKLAAMPNTVAGWRWMRCRVKVPGTGWGGDDGSLHPSKTLDGKTNRRKHSGGVPKDGVAEWLDCLGCEKCKSTDGYVLRKGSWRPTSSWDPILMLAKTGRYFCDGAAVKTAPAAATVSRDKCTRIIDDPDEQFAVAHDHETLCSGANLRDVWRAKLEGMSKEELIDLVQSMGDGNQQDLWTIAPEPLKEKHYAAYPSELVRRALKAGTSAKGYCPACGLPWVRVIASQTNPRGDSFGRKDCTVLDHGQEGLPFMETQTQTIGWRPSCNCIGAQDMIPRPGRVLDPFAGSGRTGLEARRLGLDFVGLELNPDYADMARRLLYEAMPLFSQQAGD